MKSKLESKNLQFLSKKKIYLNQSHFKKKFFEIKFKDNFIFSYIIFKQSLFNLQIITSNNLIGFQSFDVVETINSIGQFSEIKFINCSRKMMRSLKMNTNLSRNLFVVSTNLRTLFDFNALCSKKGVVLSHIFFNECTFTFNFLYNFLLKFRKKILNFLNTIRFVSLFKFVFILKINLFNKVSNK